MDCPRCLFGHFRASFMARISFLQSSNEHCRVRYNTNTSGQLYSALAKTLLTRRRVNLTPGLGWLRDRRKPGAIASGTFDFQRCFIRSQRFHGHHFLETTPTHAMSLWRTDCWLRLSHFNVTPDQFVSVTVPWSFLSSSQQTRAPTFNILDWEPVIRFCRF